MSTSTPNAGGGYSGIKTVIFTIGVGVLILASLYVARCCTTSVSIQNSFLRNRFRGRGDSDHVHSEFTLDRRSEPTGDEPRFSDVWIASWYPPCSHPESQLEKPGLTQAQDDGQKHDPDSATDHQGRLLWAGLLPLSAEKVPHVDTTVSPQLMKVGSSSNRTLSTKIQISTVILMPSHPPTSLPSTSFPTPAPPREYALGTSLIPYSQND